MQLREPKAIGFNLTPCFDKSNKHSPDANNFFDVACDSLSFAGCISIQSIPSLLQSVLKILGRVVSNRATIGADVMHAFRLANSLINACVQDADGFFAVELSH